MTPGNPPPWFDDVDVIVEVTDGGSIIQPVLPGVVAITLPQFGSSVYTANTVATGWGEFHWDAFDDPKIQYDSEGVSVGPYQYVIVTSTVPLGRHGIITTAFYPVTVGHVLRYTINAYGSNSVRPVWARIEGYNATTTVVLASWEQEVVSTDAWTTLSVTTAPIPAGVTRVRFMAGGTFSTFGRHAKLSNPVVWDDPMNPAIPPITPITWRDVTCDVASVTTRYGRTKLTERFDVGTVSVVLRNVDGDYAYRDPHPQGFGPGRLIRVTAIHDDVTYPLAYGVIDSIQDDFDLEGKSTVVVTAYDPTSLWGSIYWRLTYGISAGSGELTGARINRLLDYVSYTSRSVDVGTIAVQALPSVSGRPLRDDAGVTADTEGGAVFAERNGMVVFRDANWRNVESYAKTVTANLNGIPNGLPIPYGIDGSTTDDPAAPELHPSAIVTDWSLVRVINRVSLANAGGTAQNFDSIASQLRHGIRPYQRLDLIGTSDGYLAGRAAALLAQYNTARLRVNAVTVRPVEARSAAAWIWTLRVFFNWLVRVWYAHPDDLWGFGVAAYVQGIEHRITPTDWVTTLRLDDMSVHSTFDLTAWSVWGSDSDATAHWDEVVWDGAFWDFVGHHEPAYWDTAVWT